VLHGEKVVLRALERGDLPLIAALRNDLEVESRASDEPPVPTPLAVVEQRYDERRGRTDGGTWLAVTVDGEVVGDCAVHTVDTYARTCQLGIALGRAYWGRGYGTDAVRTLTAFAFTHLNMRKVSLEVLADEPRAVGAYRRAGFVEEGRFVQQTWHAGRYHDVLRMAVLRPGG
jgi:RimJ/RimL family protein N-acetyltransferase